jgi:hypothetical protein
MFIKIKLNIDGNVNKNRTIGLGTINRYIYINTTHLITVRIFESKRNC